MPGGKRNPLNISNVLQSLGDAINQTKSSVKERKESLTQKLADLGIDVPYVDLEIRFIGARDLPKMDVVGSADPYLVAKIDDAVSFVSAVKPNTLAPVWNEVWRVKNVPNTADLTIEVLDKDEGAVTDDFIGSVKTTVAPGTKEVEIQGPILKLRKSRGTLWLTIASTPSVDSSPSAHPYLFAGPIRFSRHYSPTVGLFTSTPDDDTTRLYSTWKLYMPNVPLYFEDIRQPWNKNYRAAQNIFEGPASIAVRSGIQAGHRMLYARTAKNGFGVIESKESFMHLLHGGPSKTPLPANAVKHRFSSENEADGHHSEPQAGPVSSQQDASNVAIAPVVTRRNVAASAGISARPNYGDVSKHNDGRDKDERPQNKPAVYTYIISSDDNSFRFSETGAAFFVDFASKHALHSNCAQTVIYSGEFHPRPALPGGWASFDDSIRDSEVDWEIVIDNNSGTYAPDKDMLPKLQAWLESCLFGIRVVAMDYHEKELETSREACREYALRCRGVKKEELQPHVQVPGEMTLSQQAAGGVNACTKGSEDTPPDVTPFVEEPTIYANRGFASKNEPGRRSLDKIMRKLQPT